MSSRSVNALLLVLLGSAGAFALSAPDAPGTPELGMGLETWKDGWSLLAGMGVTRTRFYTDNQSQEKEGHGPNLMTSVGYCDRDAYCLELGSIVSFDYYDDMMAAAPNGDSLNLNVWIWETALFFSVRTRLPHYHQHRQFNPWIKLLSGYGASVGYPQKWPAGTPDSLRSMRIQTEGPLYGLSVMNVFNNDKPGRVWFVEGTAIIQMNWNNWLIKGGGLLPEVAQTGHTSGNSYTLLLNLTVGVRVF